MNIKIKKLFNYFLIGVFAFIPIVVIIQIVLFLEQMITVMFQMVYGYAESFMTTALVFAISFAIFSYIGYRVSEGRSWIIAAIDAFIDRVPFLNTIYRVTKKVVNMFSGQEQKEEREVVYIEYPKEGLWVPAYVTNRKDDVYVLFVPTSPNPTSGFTIIVHESKVIKSAMNIEQATSFVVSVGVDFVNADEVGKLH